MCLVRASMRALHNRLPRLPTFSLFLSCFFLARPSSDIDSNG